MYGALINIKVNTRLMKDADYKLTLENKAQNLLDEYANRALKCYETIMERLNG